jgi:hypothetical protein
VALNLFRYGVPWNRYYVRSGWEDQSLPRRAEFFGAELVSPNAGLVWFWPVASMVIAVCGYHCARALRAGQTVRSHAGAIAAALITFGVLLATLASWWSPFGWFAFGSRLIVPWIPPLLALCAAAASEPVHAAFTRLTRSIPLRVAGAAVVGVLGLAQLGAMLQPLRPLTLFDEGNCPYVPDLSQRIPAGNRAAHAAENTCLSRRAWIVRPVLADSLRELGGGDAPFGILFVPALAGLAGAAAGERDGSAAVFSLHRRNFDA